MTHPKVGDRLGPLDTLFLYIEKKEMPLHIGSVFVFDGPLSAADLKTLIRTKLPLIPRYRQRVSFPPLNIGYPNWEWDRDFDLDRHISHARIEPGTKDALEKLAGELFSNVMDRSRPLWDLTIVDGLDGGRSALIGRVHHCLVDGVAGVALMNLILDQTPEPVPATRETKAFHTPKSADPNAGLLDAMSSSSLQTIERFLAMQSAVLDLAGETLRDLLQGSIDPSSTGISDSIRPLDRFPFKAPALGPRRVSWTEFSLPDVDAIRKPLGVKVNDVLLMALSSAMSRYAKLHRRSVKKRVLRIMAPVNLRSPGQNGVGNRISLVPVNIPLDVDDPIELLKITHERSEALRKTHAADTIVLGGSMLALLPVPIQAMLTGMLSNTVPVLPFDMVCTNVPGPQVPLYLLGRKMLTYYPYVPIGDFMGVSCAMVSYNGTLYFGLTGDCACAPDLDILRDFLAGALIELQERSRATPQPRRRRTSKPTTVSPFEGLAAVGGIGK